MAAMVATLASPARNRLTRIVTTVRGIATTNRHQDSWPGTSHACFCPSMGRAANSRSMERSLQNVIWAVDSPHPPEEVATDWDRAADFLQALTNIRPLQIEAVHVLHTLPPHLLLPGVAQVDPYAGAIENSLQDLLSRAGLDQAGAAHVLVHPSVSVEDAAQILSEHAETEEAAWIVTSTHARSGLKKLFLGSFTEALLRLSSVPILTLGPQVRRAGDLRKILFATELDSTSRMTFHKLVRLASTWGGEITLFHCAPRTVETVLQSSAYLLSGAWASEGGYFSKREDDARELAESWARWGRIQGVKVEIVISPVGVDIARAILRESARGKSGLIAMDAKSNSVISVLMGSITRQVVRASGVPVLLFGRASRKIKVLSESPTGELSAA